jgi:hypothetical protein
LFTYNITFGDMLQLIREPGDSATEPEEQACDPVQVEASDCKLGAASSVADASSDAPKAQASESRGGSSSGGVTCRVTVGLNEDGTIACEQPPGTVHNTDRCGSGRHCTRLHQVGDPVVSVVLCLVAFQRIRVWFVAGAAFGCLLPRLPLKPFQRSPHLHRRPLTE